jgi:Transposase IS66 family
MHGKTQLRRKRELTQGRVSAVELEGSVINADETPVQVLDPTRNTTRTGYFWSYISPGKHGYTVY